MKFDPHPFQVDAYNQLGRAVQEGSRRILLKAPTGVGKTYMAAMVVDGALKKGRRVAFVAPYSVLIDQTVDRFSEQYIEGIGVMQGQHELTDPYQPVQICTAQTLGRRRLPDCDVVIVDEAHLQYKVILDWMEAEPEKIFIGLTATPFAKGMGKHYQKLIKIKSLGECLEDGTLSEYEVFGVEKPDLSSVGIQGGEYKNGELGDVMGDAKLVGNIVRNWLENGDDRQTIVFAVNVLHANKVANDFENAGISVDIIVAKTPLDERRVMFERFENRQLRVLVSVGCLIAGFDSYVDCIVWAAPTKSAIKFIQGIGRGLRKSKGKDLCKIFDHSGTFTTMGFIEDVDAEFYELHDGDKQESKSETEAQVKPEKKPKTCPKCKYLKEPGQRECPKCGFTPRHGEDVEVDESRELKALKKNKKHTKEEKELFYRCLKGWQLKRTQSGKYTSKGRVAHIYRDKFGVWPNGLDDRPLEPTPEVLNFIKSRNIAFAKSQKR